MASSSASPPPPTVPYISTRSRRHILPSQSLRALEMCRAQCASTSSLLPTSFCNVRPAYALSLLLAFAGLAAADSDSECRDGLSMLNNKAGQSPCAVKAQLEQACHSDSSTSGQCTCNTVTYNIGAACAACHGESIPNWAAWADDNDCGSNPLQFPSHMTLSQDTIPGWAYQQLSASNDFNLTAAIVTSDDDGPSRPALAAQVAVPIATGVGVALIAILSFYLYQRRKWRRHHLPHTGRMKTLPQVPDSGGTLARPWHFLYAYWPSARSRRLRPSKKDSDWAIDGDEDEDTKWLGHASRGSRGQSVHLPLNSATYVDPYALTHEPEPLDVPHTSAHIPETSSSSLLPRPKNRMQVELPPVRAPTIVERIVNSVLPGRNALRKSPTYELKYVSPSEAGPQFQIDGGPTPVAQGLVDPAGAGVGRGGRASGSGRHDREARAEPSSSSGLGVRGDDTRHARRSREEVAERSDFRPQRTGTASSVLLISRDGRDFSIDDTTTTTHTGSPQRSPSTSHHVSDPFLRPRPAPRRTGTYRICTRLALTPASSPHQPPSSYSPYTPTGTGTGSWLPSPHRANTASTLSGAYPSELRRDPDLASPGARSWATRFPAPPQMFDDGARLEPSPAPRALRSFAADQMDRPPAYEPPRGRSGS
ncbi:hypothetical protein FKP32DRAFT_1677942 [Trametes sanguinea]|nr:hypothetical protein FKP32DRAFT_1677942 [Trametes sanguinea]